MLGGVRIERGREPVEHVTLGTPHHGPPGRVRDLHHRVVAVERARRDHELVDVQVGEPLEHEAQHRATVEVLQHLARQPRRTGARLHYTERRPDPAHRDINCSSVSATRVTPFPSTAERAATDKRDPPAPVIDQRVYRVGNRLEGGHDHRVLTVQAMHGLALVVGEREGDDGPPEHAGLEQRDTTGGHDDRRGRQLRREAVGREHRDHTGRDIGRTPRAHHQADLDVRMRVTRRPRSVAAIRAPEPAASAAPVVTSTRVTRSTGASAAAVAGAGTSA